MSEREAEPADVRPFLPRPGEPVEEYAERLRAMHRDLSVVLQAVERGLQRAQGAEEAPAPPPAAVQQAAEPVRMASAVREPTGTALREGPIPGAPRVEVVTTRTGHRAGDEAVDTPWAENEPFIDRRQPIDPSEHHQPSPRPDDPRWAHAVPAPPFAQRPSGDALHAPAPRIQPPLAERPSADPRYAETVRVGEWVSAPAPPPRPSEPPAVAPPSRTLTIPPWVLTAILAGWLTIVALLLALLLDG